MASHRGTVKLVFSALLALGLCSVQARPDGDTQGVNAEQQGANELKAQGAQAQASARRGVARQSVENRASAYGYGQPGAQPGYGGHGRVAQGYPYGGNYQGGGSNPYAQPGANPYAQPGYTGYANSVPGGTFGSAGSTYPAGSPSANPYQGGGSGGAYAQNYPAGYAGGLSARQGGARGKRDTRAAYQDSANNLYQDGGARLF
ncbi:unnamed protein product [Ixodes persulcatus]